MEKVTMTTQDLVKAVATITGKTQKEVKEVVGAFENVIKEQVAVANASQSVEVKLFNGLTLISEHVAPRQARNPQTGETFITEAKNRVKAKIGTSLKDAANA